MRLVTIDEGVRGTPGALLASSEVLHLAHAAAPGTAAYAKALGLTVLPLILARADEVIK